MQVSATRATVKGHGLTVGDKIMFHGMVNDGFPNTEAGTLVVVGKDGAKYTLTSVEEMSGTGTPFVWTFGAAAQFWASPVEKVEITEHTLNDGTTVYSGKCVHGWMTGFYADRADAVMVAAGHGEVSVPVYETPTPDAVKDVHGRDALTVTVDGRVYVVTSVDEWGAIHTADGGTFNPGAVPGLDREVHMSGLWAFSRQPRQVTDRVQGGAVVADILAMIDADMARTVARVDYFGKVLVKDAHLMIDMLPEHVDAAREAGLLVVSGEWLTVAPEAVSSLVEGDRRDAWHRFNPGAMAAHVTLTCTCSHGYEPYPWKAPRKISTPIRTRLNKRSRKAGKRARSGR